MGKITKTVLIVSIAILAFAWLQNDTKKDVSPVEVKKVIDGDTIEVSLNGTTTIRFLGVDSPELDGENDPGEFRDIDNETCLKIWGEKAKNYTRKKLKNSSINLVYDSKAGKKGYYGRTLAYVEINDTDFTKELIETGYARVYDESDFKREVEYLEEEKQAYNSKKGLWSCESG